MEALSSVDNLVDNPVVASDYLDTRTLLRNNPNLSSLEKKKLALNIANWLTANGRQNQADKLMDCGQNWLGFECSEGHRIYHQVNCKQPFCPVCGHTGAGYNKKRLKKVREFLYGFPMIGHYVFTLPKELTEALPSSEVLNKLYQLAWKVLRESFDAEAAIIALHFCGDKRPGLHLHFDCSFPILYRNGDCSYPLITLKLARAEWTSGVNKIFNAQLNETVGHYNFVNTLEQSAHLIKYVTRSTMPADKFIELSDQQKAYCLDKIKGKTIRYYGKFVGKKRAAFLETHRVKLMIEKKSENLVEQNICPICNEKMKPLRDKQEKRIKMFRADDLPLSGLVRYNNNIFVDQEISAFLRSQEAIKAKKISDEAYRNSGVSEYLLAQRIDQILKGADYGQSL